MTINRFKSFSSTSQWIAVSLLIAAVVVVGIMTNVTLRSVEKNLPNTLLTELQDLSLIIENLSGVIYAVERARHDPVQENYIQLRQQVELVFTDIVTLRNTYVFDNLINASAFHAVVAPAIADLKIWLREGVSGFGPETEVTLRIALARINGAFAKARTLYYESQVKAQSRLSEQHQRIEKFLLEANLLFVLTLIITFSMVLLFIRKQMLQKREIQAQAGKIRVEQSLRESEEKHRALVETTDTGFFIINENGIVLDANNEYARLTDHKTREEIIGKNVLEWTADSARYHYEKAVAQCLMAGSARDLVIDYVNSSGESIPIEINATVVETEQGKQILSLCRDITDRKRTQEMMIQTEKMMSVGGLAAGMAHEINNPLAGMIQNAQVINNRLTKDLPANVKAAKELGLSMPLIKTYMKKRGVLKQLNYINQAGMHAAKIVENMLNFARRSEGKKQKQFLEELLETAIDLAQNDYNLKKKYDFKKIKIIREYDSDIPSVLCEKSAIQQVLFNIFKNASEAMSLIIDHQKSPRLILRLKKISTMVKVEIEDNGIGMDSVTQKRVFEPFFTTKSVNEGTGIGLSVSYFIIVDDHKGKMEVQSTFGKGTKFIIKLPF